MSWLLWTLGCMCLFELLEFCMDICPRVGLLDHLVTIVPFLKSFKKWCQLVFPRSRFWQQCFCFFVFLFSFFRKCPWNPPCGRKAGSQTEVRGGRGCMHACRTAIPSGGLESAGGGGGAGCGCQQTHLLSVTAWGCFGQGAPWVRALGHRWGGQVGGVSHSPSSSWNSKSCCPEGGPAIRISLCHRNIYLLSTEMVIFYYIYIYI